MAGGIDWFRWHHGSVTDPKFQLVARKAGVRLPDVLAVWAFVLEKASASEERGSFGEVDCEAVDCLFGLDDGKTAEILEHMGARGLVVNGSVAAWEKRQPKREREGDSSTNRVREFRERQRQQEQGNTTGGNETPCNANETQETPRGEERRVDTSFSDNMVGVAFAAHTDSQPMATLSDKSPPAPKARPLPDGWQLPRAWGEWALAEYPYWTADIVRLEGEKFRDHFRAKSGKDARKADWQATWRNWCRSDITQRAHQRGADPQMAETIYQRSMRERMQEAAPEFARKGPPKPTENVIEFFAAEAATKRLEIGNEPTAALG